MTDIEQWRHDKAIAISELLVETAKAIVKMPMNSPEDIDALHFFAEQRKHQLQTIVQTPIPKYDKTFSYE